MDIRAARTSDREAVQALWASAGLDPASEREWDVLVAGGCASLLVADDGAQILGAAVVAYDGWRAFVYHLAVSADARRQGVGSALMAEAERTLRQKGARLIFALVNERMTDGLALLAASGYEPEGDLAFVKSPAA